MAIGRADHGWEYAVDLNIPDVAAFQGGQSHEAHATFDGVHPASRPKKQTAIKRIYQVSIEPKWEYLMVYSADINSQKSLAAPESGRVPIVHGGAQSGQVDPIGGRLCETSMSTQV